MRLYSPAFKDGEAIPKLYTEDGENISPPLRWDDVPSGVEEFALIMEDPDAPRPQPWVHWVIYKIPGHLRQLPENMARGATPVQPAGSRQGHNSWSRNNVGYRGPAPPRGHGPHRYFFRLYALAGMVDLAPEVAADQLQAAMKGHIRAEAELIGTYERASQEKAA